MNCYFCAIPDLVFTRIAPGAPRDNYFELAKHSSDVIQKERHEVDHSTAKRKTQLFGVAGKLVRVFINKMILIFPVCALDSGFKPRQLLA